MVTPGSRWKDSNYETYVVIDIANINGKNWIYYRLDRMSDENKTREFSCYEESFVARFTEFNNHIYEK
jgi:hypothetical protein